MTRISDIFIESRRDEPLYELVSDAFRSLEEQIDELRELIEEREELTTEYIREVLNDT
jgi:hypothetical protein